MQEDSHRQVVNGFEQYLIENSPEIANYIINEIQRNSKKVREALMKMMDYEKYHHRITERATEILLKRIEDSLKGIKIDEEAREKVYGTIYIILEGIILRVLSSVEDHVLINEVGEEDIEVTAKYFVEKIVERRDYFAMMKNYVGKISKH